jgi:hypothetical protein
MALFFDQVDDQFLNAGNWDVGGDKISFGSWIQSDNLNPFDFRFINYAEGLQDHIWMLSNIRAFEWHPRIRIQANGTTTTMIGVIPPNSFDLGWHHIVGTYDGSLASNHMKIYFDGLLNSEGDHGDPGDLNTDAGGNKLVTIAANLDITLVREPLLGRASEAFVYKHVLSPEEVWLLFKHRDPQTIHRDKLRGHWRCNSRGLFEPDLSGWRHHAIKGGITGLPTVAPDPPHYRIFVPLVYPRSAGGFILTPAAIVVTAVIPGTTTKLGPDPVTVSPVVPAVDTALGGLTPIAVSAAVTTADTILGPDPVVVTAAFPAVDTALGGLTPISVSAAVTAAVTALGPDPVVVTAAFPVADITLGSIAAAVVSVTVPQHATVLPVTPIVISVAVPEPVDLTLGPDTVVVTAAFPLVDTALGPDSFGQTIVVPAPTVVEGIVLTPAAIVVTAAFPITTTLLSGLSPISISAVMTTGSCSLGPDPIVVTATISSADTALGPDPVVVTIVVPAATVVESGFLKPVAIVVTAAIPLADTALGPDPIVVTAALPTVTTALGGLTPISVAATITTADTALGPNTVVVTAAFPTITTLLGGFTPISVSAVVTTADTALGPSPLVQTIIIPAVTIEATADKVLTPLASSVTLTLPAVTIPTGLDCNFSKAFDAWERLVASSPRVQDLLNELTPEMAKERIHWLQSIRLPDPELVDASPNPRASIHPRPYAVIDVSVDEYVLDSDNEFRGGGTVVLAIEAEIPSGVKIDRGTQTSAQLKTNWKERMAWMAETSECVLIQLTENSGKFDSTESFLNVMDLSITQGPGEFGDDESDRFMGLVITGTWT